MGPSGISLRVDDRNRVEALYQGTLKAGADITQGPEASRVAFSFSATDADGNQMVGQCRDGNVGSTAGLGIPGGDRH